MPFVPNFLLRDLVGWLSALAVLAALAAYFPAELGRKADPFLPAPAGHQARVVLHVHVPDAEVPAEPHPRHRGRDRGHSRASGWAASSSCSSPSSTAGPRGASRAVCSPGSASRSSSTWCCSRSRLHGERDEVIAPAPPGSVPARDGARPGRARRADRDRGGAARGRGARAGGLRGQGSACAAMRPRGQPGVGPAIEELRRPQGAYELAGRLLEPRPGHVHDLEAGGDRVAGDEPAEMADLMAYLQADAVAGSGPRPLPGAHPPGRGRDASSATAFGVKAAGGRGADAGPSRLRVCRDVGGARSGSTPPAWPRRPGGWGCSTRASRARRWGTWSGSSGAPPSHRDQRKPGGTRRCPIDHGCSRS